MRFLRLSTAQIAVAGILLATLAIGCGGGHQTAEQALQAQLKLSGVEKQAVFPLAGRVTIDGQPPGSDTNVVVVMLNDPQKPNLPLRQRPHTTCEPSGDFSFSTYVGGDGFPPGDYIATFAMLVDDRRGPVGPDQLKNLYNDPEKNNDIPEFHIDHKAPGRKDYAFNLKVNGKDEVRSPGKYALTGLVDPQRMKGGRR